jgi:hypothetical protein
MTKNMSLLDRKLRGFAATPLLLIAALLVGVGTAPGIVLLALAAVIAVTSLVGFCPLRPHPHQHTRPKPLPH